MKISNTEYNGRKAWCMDNNVLRLIIMHGGGHLAALNLVDGPDINPFWEPVWPSKEPWEYRPEDASAYESRLLASICGHNLCLPWFGDATEAETAQGLGSHGEAPVTRWRLLSKAVTQRRLTATIGCDLKASGLRFARTIEMNAGSHVIHLREQIINLNKRDIPYTQCEHVTLGPPFLEKGETVFDMPATSGHTFPTDFESCCRLKPDTAFQWPAGPGAAGETVDLRMIARRYRKSSDFSTQLMNPELNWAWFTALHPRKRLLLAYVWDRADFPWVGNWEENYGRKRAPWNGKSLTRGMEFANTPFPTGLKDAVERGTFQNEPVFRWLPARGRHTVNYKIVWKKVPKGIKKVSAVKPEGTECLFEW